MKYLKRFLAMTTMLSSLIFWNGCSDKTENLQTNAEVSDGNSYNISETSSSDAAVSDPPNGDDFSDIDNSIASETETRNRDNSQSSALADEVSKPDEDALAVQKIIDGTLEKSSALLDVTPLYQYPELPTGCESVSLTMVLNYLGENLSLTEIASDYLVYGDNMVTGYCGDPFGDYGAGVFPPGLLATAKNYISSNSRPLAAADTTGTSLSDLFKLIDKGFPVVIWSTSSLRDPYNNDDEMLIEYNGYEYWWYTNEHCVALIGYDLDNGTVTINDPQYGCSLTYSIERFEYVYDKIRRMSVAIIKK